MNSGEIPKISPAHFEQIAAETVLDLPDVFRQAAQAVVVQIVECPPSDILRDLEIEDPLELTGLYDGIPLTQKSVMDPGGRPDMVWLFRRPILQEWQDRGNVTLDDLIRHVMIHELAHHFGWSDDDIAVVDPWWE